MMARRLIEDARAAGLSIEVENGDLIVEADRDPPPGLLAKLRQHKAELIEALLPREDARPKLNEPVLLRDGRRRHRFRAAEIPTSVPGHTEAFMDDVRWRRIVLVADGYDLIVVEPWLHTLAPDTLLEIKREAGNVIAALRRESRDRDGDMNHGVQPRGDSP
jgi:hypothetical protein